MSRIVARLARGTLDRFAAPRPPADFDADFYRGHYDDLAGLTAEAAARHYARRGVAEGRSRNAPALIAALGLHLPPGYALDSYRDANPDLAALTDADLLLHLARDGVREGRRHRAFNPDLYRELHPPAAALSDAAAWLDFRDDGAARGRVGSGRELARARGWPGGAWIDAIRLSEFRWLNWRWAADVEGIVAAAERLLEAGGAHLASPSFAQRFDAAHLRETHPAAEGDDAALHRAWLFTDAHRLAPGNAQEHLRRLGLSVPAYPAAFRWGEYAAAHPAAGATRWSALEHLVSRAGGPAPPCEGPEGAAFLLAVAEALATAGSGRAMEFVRAAQALDSSDPDTLRRAAEVCGRCGRWEEALAWSRSAARHPRADLAVFVGGARAAVASGRPAEALELLAEGAERHGGSPRWSEAAGAAIAAEFEAALAAPGADIGRVAADCGRRWAEFGRPGATVPPADDGRLALLVGPGLAAAARLRLWRRLLEALARPCTVHDAAEVDAFVSDLPGCAAAVLVGVPADPRSVHAVDAARRLGVPTLHDSAGADVEGADRRPADALAALCGTGVAATPGEARRLRETGVGAVHLLPDAVEAADDSAPPRLRSDGAVTILHDAGLHDPEGFARSTAPLLRRVLEAFPAARLVLAGNAPPDAILDASSGDGSGGVRARVSRVESMDPLADPEGRRALMAEADIHLERASAATHLAQRIVRLEAAAAGAPTVAGDLAPEARSQALLALVADAGLRRREGEAARGRVRSEHATAALAARLDAVLPRPAPSAERRPRVLLVNVFFAPQSFGGATRIVEENLHAFLEEPGAAGVEFAVATTDVDAAEPYRLRVDAHRGVPVFRFGTPAGDGADRRAFDPQCGRVFSRILDAWTPDVVHFHCVQRMTASAVAACAERGLPYLVTLHDAWWISDHQFLLDHRDELQDPRLAPSARPTPGVSTSGSLMRRRRLGDMLRGAERVLAVSESFAALHRGLGFERVEALANGAAPVARLPRTPSASGRVRLCHLGGAGAHKGLPLLRACLMQCDLPGLELTVVEPERVGGREVHEVWGATPVRRTGRVEREDMARFYAGQDVLVAPSLWPESFGLVTREAVGAGLWVVAGDRGAIGEAVSPGVNGWVVDVSTPAALAAVLSQVAADPARHLRPPPVVPAPAWTGADQARALLAAYRAVLAAAPAPPAPGVSRPGPARDGGA